MSDNCWQILGIEPTDDLQIIRNAYRKKLPEFHPESDPEGFQRLRQAFEQAKQSTEAAMPLVSLFGNDTSVDIMPLQPKPPVEVKDVEQLAVDSLLQEFRLLQDDPLRVYQTDAWYDYIELINQQPLEVIQRLRWLLFTEIYEGSDFSKACVKLLAERMGWQQRIGELNPTQAQELDNYLEYLERGDSFDLSILIGCSRAAQRVTYRHISTLSYLLWNNSLQMFREYAARHTVVYLPDSPALMLDLTRWYSLGWVGCEPLRDLAVAKLEDNENDADWLHMAARQSSMLGDNNRAIRYWLKLYEQEKHADAVQWLLGWCRAEEPAYLPLLIQAFDEPQYGVLNDVDLTSDNQIYALPSQNGNTLIRWGEAARYDLPPLAAAYVKWRLSSDQQPHGLLRFLIDDTEDDLLLRLYRHAAMLRLGNEALLQGIFDEPEPENGLADFILRQLKRQAIQQVDWLQQSTVLVAFNEWLYGDSQKVMPDVLADRQGIAIEHALLWLARFRWLPQSPLYKLRHDPTFSSSELQLFRWTSFISYQGDIVLPEPKSQLPEDVWQWYRSACALSLLLEQPAEIIEFIQRDRSLCLPEEHPLYELREIIDRIDLQQSDWPEKMTAYLQLSNIMHYQLLISLPYSLEFYLNRFQEQSLAITYSRWQTIWSKQLAAAPMIDRLLLHAIYARQDVWDVGVNFEQLLRDFPLANSGLGELRDLLLNGRDHRYNVKNELLGANINERTIIDRIAYLSTGTPLTQASFDTLMKCRDDGAERPTLRLCAGLLLNWSESLDERKRQDVKEIVPPNPFFWIFLLIAIISALSRFI